jgi:hypothetical protein
LPQDAALRLGARSYLTLVETLGWTRPDWRAILDRREGSPAVAGVPPVGPVETAPARPNPLDYSSKVHRVLAVARHLGLEPEELAEYADRVRRAGLERFDAIEALDAEVRETGFSPEALAKILTAVEEFAEGIGVLRERVPDLLVGLARTVVRTLGRAGGRRGLRAAIEELAGLTTDVAAFRQEAARLPELRRECEEAQLSLDCIRYEIADLEPRRARMAADAALARDLARLAVGELDPRGPFARLVFDGLHSRRCPQVVRMSPEVVRDLFARLVQRVAPNLVPEWRLARYRQEARQEAARALRPFVEQLAARLSDPVSSLGSKLRALEEAKEALALKEAFPA